MRIHDGNREGWVDKAAFVPKRDAPAYFDRRVQSDPIDTWALFMRGVSKLENGEPDIAIKDFDECIQLDPTDTAHFNVGEQSGSTRKIITRRLGTSDEAIRLDQKYAIAFNNRGNSWHAKKEYEKAILDYDEAIRLDPMFCNAFRNRGMTWSNIKEYDKAIRDFDEAIRLDSKFDYVLPTTTGAIGLERIRSEYDKGDPVGYDEAIPKPRPQVLNSSHFTIVATAWQADINEYDKAIRDFDEAIRLDPKNVPSFQHEPGCMPGNAKKSS